MAQRVMLASELSERGTGHTIDIVDEPTRGLSRLVDRGNTVLWLHSRPAFWRGGTRGSG